MSSPTYSQQKLRFLLCVRDSQVETMLISEDPEKVTEREREILAREYALPHRPKDPELDLALLRNAYRDDPVQPRLFTLVTGTIRLGIPETPDMQPGAHQAALAQAVLGRIGTFWNIPDLAEHALVDHDVLEQMMVTRVLRQVRSVVANDNETEEAVTRAVVDDLRAFAADIQQLADYLDV